MKQPQRVHDKTMRKHMYLANKSLRLDVLKLIAILSKEGLP